VGMRFFAVYRCQDLLDPTSDLLCCLPYWRGFSPQKFVFCIQKHHQNTVFCSIRNVFQQKGLTKQVGIVYG